VPDEITDENVKAKETAVYKLANIYKNRHLIDELIKLQKDILPLFVDLPKSKVGKIVRSLFDISMKVETKRYTDLIGLCEHIIAWCESQSRSFLRMRIENKLADLLFKLERYYDALEVLKKLLFELKRKEDK